MKSKKKWSFDVQCNECGSFLECELDDIIVDRNTKIKMVKCCDCYSPVSISHIKLPVKMEARLPRPGMYQKIDYSHLFEGVKPRLSDTEEEKLIEASGMRRGN